MTRHRPYIWLQDGETIGTAKCGCRLEQDRGAKLYLCELHASAPSLRDGVSELIRCAEIIVREWEGSHLAEAVNVLRECAEYQSALLVRLDLEKKSR